MDQPPTSTALHARSKDAVTSALVRFENLIALSPTAGKDRNVAAVDTYQMEVEKAALVRAVEDLLVVSRVLKEAWLFGRLDTLSGTKSQEADGSGGIDQDAALVGERIRELLSCERETRSAT